MISSVEQYLADLRKALSGSDNAVIQDALSDAEEYLRTALSNAPSGAGMTEAELMASVIDKYGSPAEIALAYRQIESRTPPVLAVREYAEAPDRPALPAGKGKRLFCVRYFGVLVDPRAWGSLFFLLFALVTGIIYFTWAVTGLSLSFSLLILIVGLPLAGLFLLSVRGIALLEGRMVEALLGVRMPRRPRYAGTKTGIWQHFKNLIADKHTWFSLVYMLLQMPLGITYFTVFVTLLAVSLGLIFWPVAGIVLGLPVFIAGSREYYATGWLIPISAIVGVLLVTATMHLVKATGRAHGTIAKYLLVRP